jgi:hypothetical protein
MTVHVGDAAISEVTEGSNNVIQVGGTFAAPKRYVASGFRSGNYAGTTSSFLLDYSQVEYNDADQWSSTTTYMFPSDGVYQITFNSTLYAGNNDYCQFVYNGGITRPYMYGSSYYGLPQPVSNHFLVNASEGDTFYVYTRTMYHLGYTGRGNSLTVIQVS